MKEQEGLSLTLVDVVHSVAVHLDEPGLVGKLGREDPGSWIERVLPGRLPRLRHAARDQEQQEPHHSRSHVQLPDEAMSNSPIWLSPRLTPVLSHPLPDGPADGLGVHPSFPPSTREHTWIRVKKCYHPLGVPSYGSYCYY